MERLSHTLVTEQIGSERTEITFTSVQALPPHSSLRSMLVNPLLPHKVLVFIRCLLLGQLKWWEVFFLSLSCLSLRYSTSDGKAWPTNLTVQPTYLGLSLNTRSTLSQSASCVIIVFGWYCWTGAEIHQVLVNLSWVTTAGWPEENDYEIKLLCLSNKDYW